MIDYSTFTEDALQARLADLLQDHADLEASILALSLAPLPDLTVIGRLKRKKLAVKDEIVRIGDFLHPDMLA